MSTGFNPMSMWSMYFRRPALRPVLAALSEMSDAQARAKILRAVPRGQKPPHTAPLFEEHARVEKGGEVV